MEVVFFGNAKCSSMDASLFDTARVSYWLFYEILLLNNWHLHSRRFQQFLRLNTWFDAIARPLLNAKLR